MFKNGIRPIHPGKILREDYQKELGFSAAGLARALGVAAPTVNNILIERSGISAEMALRLAACLDTTPGFWLSLQSAYELCEAEQEHGKEIASAVQRLVA